MADLVQPYIVWDGLSAFADGADATSTDDSSLASWNEVRAEWSNSFAWDVGGALHVDATALFVLPASEAAIAAGRCPLALDPATLARLRTDTNGGLTGEVIGSPTSTVHMGIGGGGGSEVNPNPNLGSETIWSNIFSTIPSNPSPLHKGWTPYGSRYTAAHAFGSAHAPDGSQWVVVAGVKADQDWAGENPEGFPAGLSPQAHVVRARTVEGYTATNGNSTIEGHRWWFSAPRCYIVQSKAESTVASTAAGTTLSTATSSGYTSTAAPVHCTVALLLVALPIFGLQLH